MLNPSVANWVAGIFQNSDSTLRHVLSTPSWDTNERGYMGAFTGDIARDLLYTPLAGGFKVSSRDTPDYDMFVLIKYKGFIKIAICEAKLVRMIASYSPFQLAIPQNVNSFDSVANGESRIFRQIRDNPWPNGVAYWYMFITELPNNAMGGVNGFVNYGSTCFRRPDVEYFQRTKTVGQRWNAADVLQIQNKKTTFEIIYDFLVCNYGDKYNEPEKGQKLKIINKHDEPVTIPYPQEGFNESFSSEIEEFLKMNKLSSYQFIDFDKLD